MAHKTLIDGTAYDIIGGRTLINGTGHSILSGKTLVDGTVYEIEFEPYNGPVTVTVTGNGNTGGIMGVFAAYITVNGQ